MFRLWQFSCGLGAAAALWLTVAAPLVAASPRPNILFIMADDHAAHAISAYGSRINRTPHLDRLAASGMMFTHCFVNNSICTPSRAAILTGQYSHRNGVTVFNRFDGRRPHVGKYLQAAGYQTAVIGKWHLFSEPTGFDYWCVLPGQGRYYNPQFLEPGRTNVIPGYVSDIITDLSLAWLKQRDPAKPFFLCTHHKAPHREWSPAASYTNLYEDVDVPYPVTFEDDYRGRSRAAAEATMRMRDLTRTDLKQPVPTGLTEAEEKRWRYQRYIKDYLRCVASVDDSVGRLLDYLEQTGLRTNTLVIYTSDQGFFLGDHGWFDKRFMYEESLRMPFLASLPGRIPAGKTNAAMILNVDFAPTFLDLAGLAIPADMQGRSLVPLLEGRRPADWRTSIYYRYYHYPAHHRVQPHLGVRTERYKLIHFHRLDEWELYDLQTDPYETNNLYAQPAHADSVQQLKSELARLKKQLQDEDQFADALSEGETLRPVPLELVLRYDFAALTEDRLPGAASRGPIGRAVGAGRVSGLKGQALRLEGQGQVTVPVADQAFDPSQRGFTLGAWCRPEQPDGVLLSWGGSGQGVSLYLQEGIPRLALRSGGQLFEVSARTNAVLKQWLHLAGMLHNDGRLQLLVNGQPAGARPAQGIQAKPREGFTIGADPGSAVGPYVSPAAWRGLIEDVRLYWGQLDQDTLREWASPPSPPGPR